MSSTDTVSCLPPARNGVGFDDGQAVNGLELTFERRSVPPGLDFQAAKLFVARRHLLRLAVGHVAHRFAIGRCERHVLVGRGDAEECRPLCQDLEHRVEALPLSGARATRRPTRRRSGLPPPPPCPSPPPAPRLTTAAARGTASAPLRRSRRGRSVRIDAGGRVQFPCAAERTGVRLLKGHDRGSPQHRHEGGDDKPERTAPDSRIPLHASLRSESDRAFRSTSRRRYVTSRCRKPEGILGALRETDGNDRLRRAPRACPIRFAVPGMLWSNSRAPTFSWNLSRRPTFSSKSLTSSIRRVRMCSLSVSP